MIKNLISLVAMTLTCLLVGCSNNSSEQEVFQVEHDKLKSDYEMLQSDYEKLQTEYKSIKAEHEILQTEHDKLVEETKDWVKLSEEEKETKLLEAEADKIAAEEALKKEQEAKAEADRLAAEEAEKKAAEEALKKEQEEKLGYDTGITFDNLSRNPDDYEYKKVKFTGQVLQVNEVNSEVQIRLATKANSWGGYSDNIIYIYYNKSIVSSRILEEDIITIYGVSMNLYTYESVMGASITLPLVQVDKIDTY